MLSRPSGPRTLGRAQGPCGTAARARSSRGRGAGPWSSARRPTHRHWRPYILALRFSAPAVAEWRRPRRTRRRRPAALALGAGGWPSARSTDLLCEWLRELASIMVAEPPLELAAGELACRLDHRAFAVQPLGLDRVEPRALARQPADQEAAAAAGLRDRAIA